MGNVSKTRNLNKIRFRLSTIFENDRSNSFGNNRAFNSLATFCFSEDQKKRFMVAGCGIVDIPSIINTYALKNTAIDSTEQWNSLRSDARNFAVTNK